MDSGLVTAIYLAIALVSITAGFWIGRSGAKPDGHRPILHQGLVWFIGLLLLAWPVLIGHVMWEVWPVVEEISTPGEDDSMAGEAGADEPTEEGAGDEALPAGASLDRREVDLLGSPVEVTPGQAYLLLVAVFGAAGATIHTATSFATYMGNRKFKISWGWWYALRPVIGTGVAIVLVVAFLGGLISLTSETSAANPSNLNPYTVAAFASLAGWFSKLVADKLEQIFTIALSNAADRARFDGLEAPTPVIESAVVEALENGKYRLTLTGTNLTDETTVQVDGKTRRARLVGDDLVLRLSKKPTKKSITVTNLAENQSDPIEWVEHEAPPGEDAGPDEDGDAPDKPAIESVTVFEHDDDLFLITITGANLGGDCSVTIDGDVVQIFEGGPGRVTVGPAAVVDGAELIVTSNSGVASLPVTLELEI